MWNDRFSKPGYLFGTEPAVFLQTYAGHLKRGDSALAVADGEGRNSVFMASCGLDVTAMDFSDVAIEKARKLAQERGVEVDFNQSDIDLWPWEPEKFDLVVAIFIQFVGPARRKAIFDGMKRTLKPGGTLMLHGYTPEQIGFGTGGPGVLENLYTADMLRQDFSGFDIKVLTAYEKDIEEGPGHSGRSALIDLIAIKPS